jgi:hypothetical protein
MLRFPYRPDLQSAVPNWRPFVSGFVEGAIGRIRFKGLLDTGSIDTVFPSALAEKLGVQLVPYPTRLVWRGQPYPMQRGVVNLELMGSGSGFQWHASVGFALAPIPYVLLGIRGCLEFFDATFCGKDLAVELTINRSFQGTVL